MAIYRVQAVIPYFSGQPEDVVVNQFHFQTDNSLTPTQEFETIVTRLQQFYRDVYDPATSRANYVNWTGMIFKVFNLADAPPRIPEIGSTPFAGAGTEATSIPTEVACVLTWKAAPQSGVPYQSLYNRIYLGALNFTCMQASAAAEFPRFAPAFVAKVAAAASDLLAANDGIVDWVQRGKRGGFQLESPIVGGWVDNGPDTQRRRSVDASIRTDWS